MEHLESSFTSCDVQPRTLAAPHNAPSLVVPTMPLDARITESYSLYVPGAHSKIQNADPPDVDSSPPFRLMANQPAGTVLPSTLLPS